MRKYSFLSSIAIIAILIIGCNGSRPSSIPTKTSPIVVSITTQTISIATQTRFTQLQPTLSPTFTITITPTITPFSYSTATYAETSFSQKLSDVILKTEEVPQFNPDYPDMRNISGKDLTNKGQDECKLDCVKYIWYGKAETGYGPNDLTLTMYRMPSSFDANESVSKLWAEMTEAKPGQNFRIGDIYSYPSYDGLPVNSHVGLRGNYPRADYYFVASQGTVVLLIDYGLEGGGFDLDIDWGGIQHFALLQFKKLLSSGYPKY